MDFHIGVLGDEPCHLSETDLATGEARAVDVAIIDPVKQVDIVHREPKVKTAFDNLNAVWLCSVLCFRKGIPTLADEVQATALSGVTCCETDFDTGIISTFQSNRDLLR